MDQKEIEECLLNSSGRSTSDDPFGGSDSDLDPDFHPEEGGNLTSDSTESDFGEEAEDSNRTSQVLSNEVENESNLTHPSHIWFNPDNSFQPKKTVPTMRPCSTIISRNSSPSEIFYKLFPKSMINYIVQCTNERLDIVNNNKPRASSISKTDAGEMRIILGVFLVMSYNRVPSMENYWSKHPSLGNSMIKTAISRDRFKILSSKMYFASPEKPADAGKTYYIDNVVECLKKTFQSNRQDSVFQSIDESMTKFKGRSSLKQYMPMKPTKRGIKMWLRCDSLTGYTYDFNIYSGREVNAAEGTLGERVVNNLVQTIRDEDVAVCCDRFFTTVTLLETLNFAALGTCNSNRKNLPKLSEKLKRGDCIFKVNTSGLIFTKWQDTKEVLLLSNCHTASTTKVTKTLADGRKCEVSCPQMIKDYRDMMGGVDRADQMSTLYELDRKSNKWWKKIFFRLLMMSCVNAWVVYNELNRRKQPFLDFLVSLAESLIQEGAETAAIRRSTKSGRIPKRRKILGNVSLHLPIEGPSRRRCTKCAAAKKEKRTKTICKECEVPLCKDCFAEYHL